MAAKKYKKLTKQELGDYRFDLAESVLETIMEDFGLLYDSPFLKTLRKAIAAGAANSEIFCNHGFLYKEDEDA